MFFSYGETEDWRYCTGATDAQVTCGKIIRHGRGFKQQRNKQDSLTN